MKYRATVLYEDKQQPRPNELFSPHAFVLSAVAAVEGYDLSEFPQRVAMLTKVIDGRPQNGVSKLLTAIRNTSRIAGPGMLFLLVDRDRIAEHVGLQKASQEKDVIAKIRGRSDAPGHLSVHFLEPNLEGLMKTIEMCRGPVAPLRKGLIERDTYLNKAAYGLSAGIRDCVRQQQPSFGDLVEQLTVRCRAS